MRTDTLTNTTSTDTNHPIALCSTAMAQLIEEFNEKPYDEGLNDIGAVAEILMLALNNSAANGLVKQLSTAALVWLKSGLIEDIFYARLDCGYHLSILCHLASLAEGFEVDDLATIKVLVDNGMLLRNEAPVLTQYIITHHLIEAGIDMKKPSFGRRDLSKMINKRVLRSRTDEYDLIILIMASAAQEHRESALSDDFSLLIRVLLSQAIRSCDHNRTALLLFIYPFVAPVPHWLKSSATKQLRQANINCADFPLPADNQIDNDYVQRAKRGLALRSMFCYSLLLFAENSL